MSGSRDRASGGLELRDVAARLGVHYQTVYRWVRTGRLAATFVDQRYVVTEADLDALENERATPRARPRPAAPRIGNRADRLHRSLLDGDETAARRLVVGLLDEGAPVIDLIELVIAPPLTRIGDAWSDGELPIWVERRASSIVERLLGELTPNPRGRRRGRAVVAALSGDRHALPTAMATAVLRDANWTVDHLGADVPAEVVLEFAEHHSVDLVVLSVTNIEVADAATATADELRSGGIAALVGGPGRSLRQLLDDAIAA
ncbi:MAG: cobalamin-dependent protein [Actinomycetota bacterium]